MIIVCELFAVIISYWLAHIEMFSYTNFEWAHNDFVSKIMSNHLRRYFEPPIFPILNWLPFGRLL